MSPLCSRSGDAHTPACAAPALEVIGLLAIVTVFLMSDTNIFLGLKTRVRLWDAAASICCICLLYLFLLVWLEGKQNHGWTMWLPCSSAWKLHSAACYVAEVIDPLVSHSIGALKQLHSAPNPEHSIYSLPGRVCLASSSRRLATPLSS